MTEKKSFILYWFVWNGWSKRHGRCAKCCKHCYHFSQSQYETICGLHNIRTRDDLICDDFDWKKEDKSIWD